MVGREVLLRVEKKPAEPGEPLLSVEDLHVLDDRAASRRARRLLRGAGRRDRRDRRRGRERPVRADRGAHGPAPAGVGPDHRREAGTSPARARGTASTRGVGHIPEDRQLRGLVLDFSLAENLALHDFREPPGLEVGLALPQADRSRRAKKLLKEFDVRGGGPQTPAAALSGGNQQKVVVAREVSRDPSVLVAAQPTRGLDVGAIEFVHRRLVAERDEGRGDPARLVRARRDPLAVRPDPRASTRAGSSAEYGRDVSEEELGFAMTGGRGEEAA